MFDININENVVTDAFKDAEKFLNSDEFKNIKKINDEIGSSIKNAGTSIIARSKNSVLQFPIYVTSSIRINEAQVIAKTFERIYATYVQTAVSNSPIVDSIEDINDLKFLRKFHTNLKESTEFLVNKYYEAIDYLDQMFQDSIFYKESINSNIDVTYRLVPTTNKYLIEECNRLSHEPLTGFIALQEDGQEETSSYDIEKELSTNDMRKLLNDYNTTNNTNYTLDEFHEKIIKNEIEVKFRYKGKDEVVNYRKIGNHGHFYVGGLRAKINIGPSKDNKDRKESPVDPAKFLKDTDIKKINSLLPYTIEATFRVKDEGKDFKFLIGIKSIMHLINPVDLSDELRGIIIGNERRLKKVRYKTGEISFSDYMFDLKNLKSDVAKTVKPNKKWISMLKRLADFQNMKGVGSRHVVELINGNVPVPNGTMILSHSDVIKLKNDTGIDLENTSIAKKLCKSLFLISFVVVDMTTGTLKALFPDENDSWSVHALSFLEGEVAKTDNSALMKELNRIVNR